MIASSTNMCALTPKPPPTSGAITRILASDTPSGRENMVFGKWGICVELQIVILAAAAVVLRDDPAPLERGRPSSVRWWNRLVKTWSASANAPSTSP